MRWVGSANALVGCPVSFIRLYFSCGCFVRQPSWWLYWGNSWEECVRFLNYYFQLYRAVSSESWKCYGIAGLQTSVSVFLLVSVRHGFVATIKPSKERHTVILLFEYWYSTCGFSRCLDYNKKFWSGFRNNLVNIIIDNRQGFFRTYLHRLKISNITDCTDTKNCTKKVFLLLLKYQILLINSLN